jgi:hypothetical protein
MGSLSWLGGLALDNTRDAGDVARMISSALQIVKALAFEVGRVASFVLDESCEHRACSNRNEMGR